MRPLTRKLWRDLWHLRGQALAIALVITSGVATYVMSLSTLDTLRGSRGTYYRAYQFADVFVSLKRAPERLRSRIAAIPGVRTVETRVVAPVNLAVEEYAEPATGLLLSLPNTGEPLLNRLYLRAGRLVDARRDDEVVIHESFALAHGFQPGDHLRATINGRQKTLTIVGIALSPEYIYSIRPGELMPDFEGYAVMWMARAPLAAAYDMEGAFNDCTLGLMPETRVEDVLECLDALLEPYGGLGAYSREDQLSHRFLTEEFRQLQKMATIFPMIFLGVAAFLLNVVVSRLVSTQREQIAVLKAFGYGNVTIGVHYAQLILAIVAIGVVGGVLLGIRFGHGLSAMYTEFYRFPVLNYVVEADVVVTAALISAAAALGGACVAIARAARLAPAEAMRPEPPASYRVSLVERAGFKRLFSQPTRMIVRNLQRRPLKALLSITGIALTCGILTMSYLFRDAVDYMVRVQFQLAEREDMTVAFVEPTSYRALYALRSLPGVTHTEPFRAVPARLRFAHRSYRTAIQGLEPDGRLLRLLDADLRPVRLPPDGVVLTEYLGKILGVRSGDILTVEVLEGGRPTLTVPVAALVRQYLGVGAYMDRAALHRLMGEGDTLSGVYLAADSRDAESIYRDLEQMPRVAGTTVREKVIQNFYDTMAEQILTFAFFTTLFAATIAFGVVYNSARISLSERGRELASLRVLGMTRGEISYVLLGELAVITLAAIPFGFLIGRALSAYLIAAMQTDLFRVPLIIERGTYAYAATVVLVSACVSALLVRRRLDHLDLVAVLKTRE